MAPKSKQAERRASKKDQDKKDDTMDATAGQSSQHFAEQVKSLFVRSVSVQNAPHIPTLLTDAIANFKGEKTTQQKPKADKAEPEGEAIKELISNLAGAESVAAGDDDADRDVSGVFNNICLRLHWSNPLGLGSPASGEESLKAWKAMKELEVDFGPRSKKKGNPALDRIQLNLLINLPRYLHILLFMMVLRSFIFRSFFACLPWLVTYQFLSVYLEKLPIDQISNLPLDQVPMEARIVLSVGFNGLLQLFFLYELFLKTYWIELLLYLGLVIYHAYAVRPEGA